MANKVMYTPTKSLSSYGKDKPKITKRKINVDYELDKNKAIINKKDASEREFNVFFRIQKGKHCVNIPWLPFSKTREVEL
jgi:hypothetical protein